MIPDVVVQVFNSGLRKRSTGDCWPFVGGSFNKRGWHRIISRNDPQGKHRYLAHRVAYELAHGEIPAGLFVLHRCDNPVCCNPAHLFLGTQSDNAKDMWEKKRGKPGSLAGKVLGPSPHRGISRESLVWAVEQYKTGRTQKDIALELGVTDVALGGAFRGVTYRDYADVVAPIQPLLGRSTRAKKDASVRRAKAQALKELGMNQYEIASHIGVCQAAVSNYLKGCAHGQA